MLGRLDKLKLKAHVLYKRVSQLKRLQTTGLPICSYFLGILPKRPYMVLNENIVFSKSSVEGRK